MVSEPLLTEYYEVLNRPKFLKFAEFKLRADMILADIAIHARLVEPKKKVKKLRDADDDMILELAQESKADFIITGNTADFTITKFKKTLIVSPMEYWVNYKP